jgi:organic radical activating enzyme
MADRITKIGIISGYKCNFACSHCCSPKKTPGNLTVKEESAILKAIERYNIKSLHFLGGEPTLYIDRTNGLLSRLENIGAHKIKITTNGHFAKSKSTAVSLLSTFLKINSVQLSYDKFHSKFLPFSYVRNLYEACVHLKLEFGVVSSVQSPLDLILLNKLKDVGDFQVGMQKVLPVGNAKKNGVDYQHPVFDRNVLSRRCPNKKVVTYLPGRGFSICCSSLVFGSNAGFVSHPMLNGHLNSAFYRLMRNCSFRDIICKSGLRNLDFNPADSSPCVLCEKVFKTMGEAGLKKVLGGMYG